VKSFNVFDGLRLLPGVCGAAFRDRPLSGIDQAFRDAITFLWQTGGFGM